MNEKLTIKELIVRIAEKSGTSKKQIAELVKALHEVIEAGLERDGEVRVSGLGTFKLKWVKARRARNLKTGESVNVPAHNKVVFFPEKAVKDKVNKDFKYLSYTILDKEKPVGQLDREEEVSSQQLSEAKSALADRQSAFGNQRDKEKTEEKPDIPEKDTFRRRKLIWWIIPLIFIIIALLIVIFYMRNCQDELRFTQKDKDSQEQVIKPAPTAPAGEETNVADTLPASGKEETVQEAVEKEPVPVTRFEEQTYLTTRGKHLFQVARETYGNPFLWALIYKDNQDKIADPEQLLTGIELVIPSLEGTPGNLARSDSIKIAEGYRILYEYYNSVGDDKARDFYYAMKAYSPR